MLKNIIDVIDFATNQVAEELDIVPQELVVAGVASDANTKITMKTHNHYTDPTEQFFCGHLAKQRWRKNSALHGGRSVRYFGRSCALNRFKWQC